MIRQVVGEWRFGVLWSAARAYTAATSAGSASSASGGPSAQDPARDKTSSQDRPPNSKQKFEIKKALVQVFLGSSIFCLTFG